jgi:hypothetical protein
MNDEKYNMNGVSDELLIMDRFQSWFKSNGSGEIFRAKNLSVSEPSAKRIYDKIVKKMNAELLSYVERILMLIQKQVEGINVLKEINDGLLSRWVNISCRTLMLNQKHRTIPFQCWYKRHRIEKIC